MQVETGMFLHRPASYRIKDNVAHIEVGGLPTVFSMSTEVLQASVSRATRALERHARGDRDIVEGD